MSPDLSNVLIATEIEHNIQVGVKEWLAQVQVFDTSLEDMKDGYYHLFKGAYLLVRKQTSNGLFYKLNHLLWF